MCIRDSIYGDLAAAAESGWDFSSRWLGEPDRLETIETSRVVPADLNAIFVRFERNLAALHRFVDAARRDGKTPLRVAWARAKEDAMEPPGERFVPGARFARLASTRAEAIDACLRDGVDGSLQRDAGLERSCFATSDAVNRRAILHEYQYGKLAPMRLAASILRGESNSSVSTRR